MRRLIIKMICSILITCLLTNCSGREKTGLTSVYTDEVYTPEFASGFRIMGKEGSKSMLIEVSDPWEGADSVSYSLLVLADDEEIPAGYSGQVLRGQASRIIVMSSTNVAMLDMLGEGEHIAGISGKRFISTPDIQQRLDAIFEVGYEGQVDYEAILAAQPDLALIYGVESASSMEGKLRELGIPFLYVGDYLEQSPLGKVEWMIALSAVTGGIDKGIAMFAPIRDRYISLRDSIASLNLPPKKVLMNAPYADSWLLPPTGSYGTQLVNDAGGEILTGGKRSADVIPITREEGVMLAKEADFWLNPGTAESIDALKQITPGFAEAGCIKDGAIYNNNRRSTPAGGNDYFESGAVHPDIILADLVRILHPGVIPGELHYYRQLK